MPRCAACGITNAEAARFCQACGDPLARACGSCGAEIAAGARFCPVCGYALDRSDPIEERKLVTVVFADLVDSAAMSERLDPERLRSVLGAYFSAVSSTVNGWGGVVEKYIGDAVVAVFGVPRMREDDPARAVSAAAEIVERVAALDAEVGRRHGVRLAVRVGVATGEAMVLSEVRPGEPLLTGEVSTIAARLQALAPAGSVLVGERTAAVTGEGFTFGETVEHAIKGRREPVPARILVSRTPGAEPSARGRVFGAPMIGREPESAAIAAQLDGAMTTRRPRVVLVVGSAGVGKSRLVREAAATATAEFPDLTVVRARCPAMGPGVTLWALAEVVRTTCAIALDDPAEVAAERLRASVSRTMHQAGDGHDPLGTVHALATTAGISLEDNPNDAMRPGAVSWELGLHWPRYVSALAANRPLMLVLEDVHWASDVLLDIVGRIATRASGPILIVATARPEALESGSVLATLREQATVVTVPPLGGRHANELLAALIGDTSRLPSALVRDILEGSGGNPLFLEEVLAELADSGLLRRDGSGWQLSRDPEGLVVPDTIQGVLGARIDALDPDEKALLQDAAVVGRIFWTGPLQPTGGDATPILLDRLERRGLVQLRPSSTISGEAEFAFKHALLRDVAYAGLSRRRLAKTHAWVARWLASVATDRPDELAETIAYHWAASVADDAVGWDADQPGLEEVRTTAFEALVRGGAVARLRWATDVAVGYHQAAVSLARTGLERARAEEELGDDHDAAYHGDDALSAWRRATELRISGSDADPDAAGAMARLSFKPAYMAAIRWGGFREPIDPAEIDRLVDQGLDAIHEAGHHPMEPWLLAVRAATASRWAAFHRTDPMPLAERSSAANRAFELAQDAGDAWLSSLALRASVGLLMIRGRPRDAVAVSRRARSTADQLASVGLRHLYTFLASLSLMWNAGEVREQVPDLESLLVLARDLDRHEVLHTTCALSWALGHLGRWDEATRVIDEHERELQHEEDMICPYVRGGLPIAAAMLARRGDRVRARDLLARLPEGVGPVGLVEGLRAFALVRLDDPAGARELAEAVLATGARNFAEEPPFELLALLEALDALEDDTGLVTTIATARQRSAELALLLPAADMADGRLASRSGDTARARSLLDRAVEGFDRLSAVFEGARAREAIAAVDPDQAGALVGQARETYRRLGATVDLDRIGA